MTTSAIATVAGAAARSNSGTRNVLEMVNTVYESMVGLLGRMNPNRDPEGVLQCVRKAALFAWDWHPGRYADGALENVALKIGADLERHCGTRILGTRGPDMPPRTRERHVLHVATSLRAVGGHTRLIINWVRTDTRSQHSILVTEQGTHPMPDWAAEAVANTGGSIVVLPSDAPLLAKALWARRCAAQDVDLVLLHHHGHDVVPTVAYATTSSPTVAVLNMADHLFWLGSGVADAVVNCRRAGQELSERRRFTRRNVILPLPLSPAPAQDIRAEARARLSIPDSQVVLLSIGWRHKYRPTSTHNFFRTAAAILEQNPDAHVYLIGPGPKEVQEYTLGNVHPRLHALGVQEELAAYHAAADIYLEGFPLTSPTALLEVARRGVACVGAIAPQSEVLGIDDLALSGVLPIPTGDGQYVETVSRLIRDPEERSRLGRTLQQRVEMYHCGDGWLSRLEPIYAALAALGHCPTSIPPAQFQATNDDSGRSLLEGEKSDWFHLLQRMQVDFKYFLPAGLIPVMRTSRRFRDVAWGEWYARLWAHLLKHWVLYRLGCPPHA
jgi:glycosyltransferase involved in cell wall biosynthesis